MNAELAYNIGVLYGAVNTASLFLLCLAFGILVFTSIHILYKRHKRATDYLEQLTNEEQLAVLKYKALQNGVIKQG